MNKKIPTILKTAVVVVWVLLLVGLFKRDVFITSVTADQQQLLNRADREEYQGIYFKDAKIGYVVNNYTIGEENTVRIDQKAKMRINVSNMEHLIDLRLQAVLLADSTLRTFSFSFDSPFYRMSAEGEVVEGAVVFELTTGSNTIRNSIPVEQPPMLPTARRGYLLTDTLNEGDKVKIPSFDPVSLTAKSTVIEYKGRDRVLINGRVNNLHKFMENYSGARINFWLDDNGDVVKEESPAGFVFLKEPKFKALSFDETSDDLLAAVAVKISGTMPDLDELEQLSYRLELPEGEAFDLDDGRQQLEGSVLTVTREILQEYSGEQQGACDGAEAALVSSPYIQAEDQEIVKQARSLIEGRDGRLAQIKALADWVYTNIEKRPVLGIPDARTTFVNRVGDCNEHAALFAALARSVGIPTHIAAGVVYHKEAFYYHAWNEVCVGDRWLSLDTTTNQLPADVSHIQFLRGEMEEQVRIGALIGKLGIEVLPRNDSNKTTTPDNEKE
ncbi:transglutaminase family protein [Desulfopila sp. IMCC35008]|uniref:transglutaminase-like domain-containing protein n=1 Tax=Desulfopila sp. IMCC35008 TaxID=2653858 RepID=UPI0013D3AA91|nr:transglutaminase-like domain-containing protein [Desulfopila sp. IMCC35008]